MLLRRSDVNVTNDATKIFRLTVILLLLHYE